MSEHTVVRATAVTEAAKAVSVGDHTFVGPHATVLGATVGSGAYLAAQTTVLHVARLGAGASVAVGSLVHARTVLPDEFFVPPHLHRGRRPVRVLSADRVDELTTAIRDSGFADAAFGVRTEWTNLVTRYRQVARGPFRAVRQARRRHGGGLSRWRSRGEERSARGGGLAWRDPRRAVGRSPTPGRLVS